MSISGKSAAQYLELAAEAERTGREVRARFVGSAMEGEVTFVPRFPRKLSELEPGRAIVRLGDDKWDYPRGMNDQISAITTKDCGGLLVGQRRSGEIWVQPGCDVRVNDWVRARLGDGVLVDDRVGDSIRIGDSVWLHSCVAGQIAQVRVA